MDTGMVCFAFWRIILKYSVFADHKVVVISKYCTLGQEPEHNMTLWWIAEDHAGGRYSQVSFRFLFHTRNHAKQFGGTFNNAKECGNIIINNVKEAVIQYQQQQQQQQQQYQQEQKQQYEQQHEQQQQQGQQQQPGAIV